MDTHGHNALNTKVYINTENTILDFICDRYSNNDNYSCNCLLKLNKYINKYLFSKQFFWIGAAYVSIYLISRMIVSDRIHGVLYIILLCLVLFVMIIMFLSFNLQIFTFISNTLIFWWKFFDACVMFFCGEYIDYSNKNYIFSLEYATLTQAYIVAIVSGVTTVFTVIIVSSMNAFVIFDNNVQKSRISKILSSLGIIMACLYTINYGLTYFEDPDSDFIINLNMNGSDVHVSARSITIEKSIDLTIFFISQLYYFIQFGFQGILLTGHIEKKWKKRKYYSSYIQSKDSSGGQVELING